MTRKQLHDCPNCEYDQVYVEVPDTSDGNRGSIWQCQGCGFEWRLRAPRKISSRAYALQIGNDAAAVAMTITELKAGLDDEELALLAQFTDRVE